VQESHIPTLVPGGVRRDLPQGSPKKRSNGPEYFEKRLNEYENISSRIHCHVIAEGCGRTLQTEAMNSATTGPTLQGRALMLIFARTSHTQPTGELDFKVHTRPDGDSYSRVMVHVARCARAAS